jgi:dihydrofolate reductase
MGKVIADISMSLDGYIAGPNPTPEEPLGKNGESLHEWVVKLAFWRERHGLEGGETGQDNDVMQEATENIGAFIMGRKMFNGGTGPWENDTNLDGWWGDTPPFHAPVFILTKYPREKESKEGGTTFTFVTDGVASAMKQAKEAAGDKDIQVSGGADVIQQFIKAGLVDEIQIHMTQVLLGGGRRLLENLGDAKFEKTRVIDSPGVTHLKFRIKNNTS